MENDPQPSKMDISKMPGFDPENLFLDVRNYFGMLTHLIEHFNNLRNLNVTCYRGLNV